jgi:hypothetical protein
MYDGAEIMRQHALGCSLPVHRAREPSRCDQRDFLERENRAVNIDESRKSMIGVTVKNAIQILTSRQHLGEVSTFKRPNIRAL